MRIIFLHRQRPELVSHHPAPGRTKQILHLGRPGSFNSIRAVSASDRDRRRRRILYYSVKIFFSVQQLGTGDWPSVILLRRSAFPPGLVRTTQPRTSHYAPEKVRPSISPRRDRRSNHYGRSHAACWRRNAKDRPPG